MDEEDSPGQLHDEDPVQRGNSGFGFASSPRQFQAPAFRGKEGSCFAVAFAEEHDNVVIPYSKTLNISHAITMECWLLLEKESTGYVIAKKQAFALAVKKQTIMIAFNNVKPAWVWKNTKHVLGLNSWHHVAVTYDGNRGEATVFVDGIPKKTFTDMEGPLDNNTENDLHFGLHLTGDFITGMIMDARIWKRALSPELILHSMNNQPDLTDSDLVGWWPTDKGFGSEVADRTENKLNGELSGEAKWVQARRARDSYPSTLNTDLLNMFNNPIGHDIRLRVDSATSPAAQAMFISQPPASAPRGAAGDPTSLTTEEVIYAHKIFLTQRCKVFQAMLKPEMREGNCREIVLQDISFNALKKLIEFIYTDQADIDGDCCLELFQAADKYDLPRLKAMCEQFMVEHVDTDNVCTMLEAADQYNSAVLRGVCMRWILNNTGAVMESESYLNMNKKLAKEVNHAVSREHFSPNKRKKPSKAAVPD